MSTKVSTIMKAAKNGKCDCGCRQRIGVGDLLSGESRLFGARHDRGGDRTRAKLIQEARKAASGSYEEDS